jgi:3-hydroxyisobutyrate dehydrogenase
MDIGFIGLGAMGRGMAANLQQAGHRLVVNDIAEAAAAPFLAQGARWAATPRALAEGCELVFTSLPTPADVEAVAGGAEGLAAGLRGGAAWFDLTTNSLDVIKRLHASFAEKGVDFLDAPASGKLAIWVGGDRAVFDRHKPVLDAMADRARYIGPIGAGTIAKLTHNMASAAMNAVMGEVLSVGVKAGLDPAALWEAIREGGAGRMRSFDAVGPRFLVGRFDPPSFQLRLLQKDINLAMQLAAQAEVEVPICGMVADAITTAVDRGWGGRDSQTFLLLQMERAGLPPFAVPATRIEEIVAKG